MNKKAVGQILKAKGVVNDAQIKKALEYSKNESCLLGEALVKTEACAQEDVSRALAKHWGLPYANLATAGIKKEIIALVPKEVAVENNIVPVT